MPALLLLIAGFGSACIGGEPDDSGDAAPTGPGTLALSFRMDPDLLPSMAEAPAGPFRGSVFREDDATSIGPVDGARALVEFEAAALDLSADGGPSAVAWTSEPIEPQIVWVLGCLDVDANDCDEGDPITIPNENKLRIDAGVETPFEVFLGMLNPS